MLPGVIFEFATGSRIVTSGLCFAVLDVWMLSFSVGGIPNAIFMFGSQYS